MIGDKNSMTKVLNIITGGLGREGISMTQLEFMKAMKKDEVQVDIAAVHADAKDVINDFIAAGCKVIKFPDRRKELISYICFLYKLIKSEKYDVVHVHGSSALMSIDLLTAKIAGVRVRIAHSRNTLSNHKKVDKLLRPLFYRSFTHAFACGKDAGEWLFGNREFTIVHNGKNLEKFNYSSKIREIIRDKYNLRDNIAIGFVGNLNKQKNIPFLADVICAYNQINPNSKFFIMGDGAEKAELVAKLSAYGVEDKVILTGRIANVHEMLQGMDLMLLPSLFEGLPNVVLEWQAEGLPCVISDVITRECAPTNLVTFMPLEAGAEDWAKKITQILENMESREKNSKSAIDLLRADGFDIEENVKNLVETYKQLVACTGEIA